MLLQSLGQNHTFQPSCYFFFTTYEMKESKIIYDLMSDLKSTFLRIPEIQEGERRTFLLFKSDFSLFG